jgi:antitoxin (DNA-binding transcriptional repressor) of toxin-antitoxin stability system
MKAKKKEQAVPLGEAEMVGVFEAKTHLSRILREAQGGKKFIITQRGKVVAEIHPPAAAAPRKSLRGDMKGKIWMSDDFCAPLPELEKYFT